MASNKAIDWASIETDYCAGVMGVREIARWYGLSHPAIHKKAKAEGWIRVKRPPRRNDKAIPPPPAPDATPPDDDLVDKGKKLAHRLMDELDSVTSHAGELEDLIVSEEKDPRRRQALLKAVSLGDRANTLRSISMSLKTFGEAAAPQGKKAERKAAAEKVGGRFTPRTSPKLIVNNGA